MQELDSNPDECISSHVSEVAGRHSLAALKKCEIGQWKFSSRQTGMMVRSHLSQLVFGFTPYDIFPDTQKGILEIGCLFVIFSYRIRRKVNFTNQNICSII